jgi:hypothetical protein
MAGGQEHALLSFPADPQKVIPGAGPVSAALERVEKSRIFSGCCLPGAKKIYF